MCVCSVVVVVAVAAGQGAETDSGEGGKKDSSLCLHAIGYLVLQTNKKKRKRNTSQRCRVGVVRLMEL